MKYLILLFAIGFCIKISGGNTTANNLNIIDKPVIAPFWDDLKTVANDGGVWSATEGTTPNRLFHIEYIGTFFGNTYTTNNLRFRITFYENNSDIHFFYFQTASAPNGYTIGMNGEDNELLSVTASNNSLSCTTPNVSQRLAWSQTLTPVSIIDFNTTANFQILNLNGSFKVLENIYCKELFESSDENLKSNIKPICSSLSNILSLRPVNYNWKNSEKDQKLKSGFIAQELQKVYPELVSKSVDDQTYAIHYTELISELVKAIQEQHAMIQQLHDEVRTLKNSKP